VFQTRSSVSNTCSQVPSGALVAESLSSRPCSRRAATWRSASRDTASRARSSTVPARSVSSLTSSDGGSALSRRSNSAANVVLSTDLSRTSSSRAWRAVAKGSSQTPGCGTAGSSVNFGTPSSRKIVAR
jgi:hypothetical protein